MKSEEIRKQLQELLANFERELKSDSLRKKFFLLSRVSTIYAIWGSL